MKNGRNIVKKLLTTTSIMALSGSIMIAPTMAASEITTGGVELIDNPGNWTPNQPASGDYIKYGADGHTIEANVMPLNPIDSATWFNILELNLDGKTPGVPGLTVSQNTVLGSVYGGVAPDSLKVGLADNATLLLSGTSNANANANDYTSLVSINPGANSNLIVAAAGPVALDTVFENNNLDSFRLKTNSALTLVNPSAKDLNIDIENTQLTLDIASTPTFTREINFYGVNPILTIAQDVDFSGIFGGTEINNAALNINAPITLRDATAANIGQINITDAELALEVVPIGGAPTIFTNPINFLGTAIPQLTILEPVDLSSVLGGANVAKAVINVGADTEVTGVSIGQVDTINIGDLVNARRLKITADNDLTLNNVNFIDGDSTLALSSVGGLNSVTLNKNIVGNADGEGNVELSGSLDLLSSGGGNKSLGTDNSAGGNRLRSLKVLAGSTINISDDVEIYTNVLDIADAGQLYVDNYDIFKPDAVNLDGILGIAVVDGNTNFTTPITFGVNGNLGFEKDAASAAASNIILANDLLVAGEGNGRIGLINQNATQTLTFGANDKTIGNLANRIGILLVDGAGSTTVSSPVFANAIVIGGFLAGTPVGNTIFNENVNSSNAGVVSFLADGNVRFGKSITTGAVDFGTKNAVITIPDGQSLDTVVLQNGNNATVTFEGDGELTGLVNNLRTFEVGAGDVTIKTSGAHTINEIRATGTGTLTLPDNFDLTGTIDNPGGNAMNLQFGGGNSSVSGNIGASNRLGNITVNDASSSVAFGSPAVVSNITVDRANAKFDSVLNALNVEVKNRSTLKLGDDVNATSLDITTDAGLEINNNLSLNTPLSVDEGFLELGQNTLTINQNVTFAGESEIQVTPAAGGASIGNLVLGAVGGAAPTLTLAAGSELLIYVDTTNAVDVLGKTYTIVENKGGGVVTDNGARYEVDDNNADIKWDLTIDPVTFKITITAKAAAGTVVTTPIVAITAGLNAAIAAGLENTLSEEQKTVLVQQIVNSSSPEFLKQISKLPANEIAEVLSDTRAQGENAGSEGLVAEVAYNTVVNAISNAVSNMLQNRISSTQPVIAAAGDECNSNQYGAWFNPLYAWGKQKMRSRIAGYDMKAYGGTIGFDTLLNNDLLTGVAFSYVDNHLKFKAPRSGDRVKMKSYLLSLYGLKELERNFFAQGILTAGYNKIHKNDKRGSNSLGFSTAKGHFSAMNYSAEVTAGNNIIYQNNAVLTPMAGLRYSKFRDKHYKESGSTLANFEFSKNNTDKVELVAGLKTSMFNQLQDVSLTPEAHAFINYDLKGKKQHLAARMIGAGADFATRTIKPARTSYDLGVGLTAKRNMLEYGANYDLELAPKYVGHQVGLKLKVMF